MKRRIPRIAVALASAVVATAPRFARADPPADPKQECLAASDRGQNERDEGKYRAARKDFIVCAREACPAVVVQTCSKWLGELDTTAPTVVFEVKDERGNDLTDVAITLDGSPLAAAIDGRAIEMDAGSHVLRFEREGSVPVEQNVIFRTGERSRIVSATLKSLSPPLQPTEAPAVVEPASASPLTPRLVTAASLAVVAVASAGVGGYFLVQSNQKADEASQLRSTLGASDACMNVSTTACGTLNDNVQAQHGDAAAATGLFVAAGAFAVGAVVAWFLWPTPAAQPAQSAFWLAPAATPTGVTVHAGMGF